MKIEAGKMRRLSANQGKFLLISAMGAQKSGQPLHIPHREKRPIGTIIDNLGRRADSG